jgi:hypothetical protein
VQLRDQNQTPLCSGPITSNDRYTITATCSAYGHSVDLQLVLQQIDLRGFSGTLTVLNGSHV